MPLDERPIIFHKGVYKKTATTSEAVFMITGMTIGAGILGLPYAIAQVGLKIGLVSIVILGIIMLLLNLMIGEVASRTKESFQLPGLAGKYVGPWAKYLLSTTIVFSAFGALLAYIVGEGDALSNLFGGNKFVWSILFWSIGSVIIWRGLETAKVTQKILSVVVIGIIVGLSLYFFPHIQKEYIAYSDFGKLFFPYGVILFALHASPAVIEAHSLLPQKTRQFKRALIIGTIIPIIVYILFSAAVVGISGLSTHEIATTGLGELFGKKILIFGNLFAVLAMGTGFVGLGIALKQTFTWDDNIKPFYANLLVIFIPLLFFLLGVRNFIFILNIVGGIFIGLESIIMVLVYWQAKRRGVLKPSSFNLHHMWLFIIPVSLVFIIMTWYSVVNLFIN